MDALDLGHPRLLQQQGEVWNFYAGDPLELVQYNGRELTEAIIGAAGSDFVTVVKGGVFQAAETTGAYSLVGCTVAPGFDYEDFSFLGDDPELKARLKEKSPGIRDWYEARKNGVGEFLFCSY